MCHGHYARAVRGRHPRRGLPQAGGAVPSPALAARTGGRGTTRQVVHALRHALVSLFRRACREQLAVVQRLGVCGLRRHRRSNGRDYGPGCCTALCGGRLPQHIGRRGEDLRPYPYGGPGRGLCARLRCRGACGECRRAPCLRREVRPRDPALLLLLGPRRVLQSRRHALPLRPCGGCSRITSYRPATCGHRFCRHRRRGCRRRAGRRLPGGFRPPLRAGVSLPSRTAQRHRPAPGPFGPP